MQTLSAEEYKWLNANASHYSNVEGNITITLKTGLKLRGKSLKEIAVHGMSLSNTYPHPPQ